MKWLTAVVVLAVLATPALRADDAADAAKKLEGTYEIVSVTQDGEPDDKKAENTTFVFKGDTITIRHEKREQPAKFKLDPSQKPAHIDITPKDEEETLKGIYEAKDSDDGLGLTIAFPIRDTDPRPKDFKDAKGIVVVKLLRKKAK